MKVQKRIVICDAIQFKNETAVLAEIGELFGNEPLVIKHNNGDDPIIEIKTLEGIMTANIGDWIVRGIKGEFWPVKEGLFWKYYEEAK